MGKGEKGEGKGGGEEGDGRAPGKSLSLFTSSTLSGVQWERHYEILNA